MDEKNDIQIMDEKRPMWIKNLKIKNRKNSKK